MTLLPRAILIGSAGRNSGKTEFACRLIAEQATKHPVHAVKITTIYEEPDDGRGRESGELISPCPRGGEGCGACSSMHGNWCVDKELDSSGGKDTSRMLAAGADQVWWVRVREGSYQEIVADLQSMAPAGGVLVIESNGLRREIEPDLFLMIQNTQSPSQKPSAKPSALSVWSEVDIFVDSDGTGFSLDPGEIALQGGRCVGPAEATAVVLAGGKSVRMGSDKRFLRIGSEHLLEQVCNQLAGSFEQLLVSVDTKLVPGPTQGQQVEDRYGDIGPIGGVASALENALHERTLVVACDIPTLPVEFIQEMLRRSREYDIVVPVYPDGKTEQLFAVYSRSVLPHLIELIQQSERRIRMVYDKVATLRLPVPASVSITNLNTQEDVMEYNTNRHTTPPYSSEPPDFDNLLSVLRREKPARPTLFEFFMNPGLYGKLAPSVGNGNDELHPYLHTAEAFRNAGYDYVTVLIPGFKFQNAAQAKAQTHSINEGTVIIDRSSFEKFSWPDPLSADYALLDRLASKMHDGMKMIVHSPGGVLENAIALVGYENLCILTAEDPELVRMVFDHIGSRLLSYYENCAGHPAVGAIIGNDDWGFKSQTMLAPDQLREYVFPWHEQIVATAHGHGKPAILHSCGFLNEVLDDVIDGIGYDGKHSFEDTIETVEAAYERYGRRIAILGGVDLDFVCRSTPDEVYSRSRALLEMSGTRGGYALGTGNSVPEYVPDSNYFAMIQAVIDSRRRT